MDPNHFMSTIPAKILAEALSDVGNRTVYIGNIHPDTTCEELCNVIHGGILEDICFIPKRQIAFATFVDSTCAAGFVYLAQKRSIILKCRRLKIAWGKNPGPLP